jgi:hypothetical protein
LCIEAKIAHLKLKFALALDEKIGLPQYILKAGVKSKKIFKTTLIQIPMAHLKITFWQKKN